MDKEEYRIRLTTIQTMAAQQDFNAAAEVADTIDWKRVKSVRTLCMVEEIYEAAKRNEDAKRILNYAYWRAHTSKTVLYRLTEINIKTGDLSEALKYCDEFELLAPKDEKRHLLRYKLFTARKDPIEARIRLLEAYRETKFTEKWAYELASLYKENGQDDKCARLLDDMIVWFPDGKYREKAKALRDTVKKPEAEQPVKEPVMPVKRETAEIKVEPPKRRPDRPISEDAFRRTEDSAVKTQLADSWRTLVSGIRTEEPILEVPETVIDYPEDAGQAGGLSQRDLKKVKELEPETIGRTTVAPPVPGTVSEDGIQITIDDYMNGTRREKTTSELDELLSETSAHLASAVASGQYDRIRTQEPKAGRDVPAGQMSFEDFMPELQDAPDETAGSTNAALERLYGKETDETLGLTKSYSMEEDVVREIARQEKQRASEEEEKRRRRAVEETLRSAGVITEENLPDEAEDVWTQETDTVEDAAQQIVPGTGEEVPDSEKIEEMLREAEEEDEPIVHVHGRKKRAEFGGWLGRILKTDEEEEDEPAEDHADEESDADSVRSEITAAFEKAEEAAAEAAAEEAAEEASEEIIDDFPKEETVKASETSEEREEEAGGEEKKAPKRKKGGFFSIFRSLRLSEEEMEDYDDEEEEIDTSWIGEKAPEKEAEIPAEEQAAAEPAAEDKAVPERTAAAFEAEEPAEENVFAAKQPEEIFAAEPAEEEIIAPEEPAEEITAAENAAEPADGVPESGTEGEGIDLIEAITSQPETLKKLPVEPRPFTDTEKAIFSYFTKVPGMSEQITMALSDVHNNAGDKTSRSGNIMIIGRQGSGKTHLTDAIMTAVCLDLGIKETRSAKIIASEFNEKNPAEVVSKMMGGFLVIEGAGELSDEAVEKLLKAMEFRTDHLIIMLEDEKADLKALLLRHPEIEDKFTSTIVIPVFTNDELVAFAKAYAAEKGYRMDEMGILALYTMIGDNQSATEPVTVGKVKEMMDAAIEKADSGTRRLGRRFARRAQDKEGKVILREKDFDI